MIDEGLTVREAAQRLNLSEATVRRRLGVQGPDSLEAVAGSRPIRVSKESVERAQGVILRRMGLLVGTQISSGNPSTLWESTQIPALEARIKVLEGALTDLTTAHSALLDTYRRLSEGAIPNH